LKSARMAVGVLLAAFLVAPAWAQEQSAPPSSQQPAAHPMRIRVGGSVQRPNLIHIVQPQFHSEAKIKATVVLHVVIDRDGTVMSLDFVSGFPLLEKPVMDAVKQWRYRPTKLNGQPVQVDTTINVVIETDDNGDLKPQPQSPKS
jgi:periplasmic protein TonB